MHHTRRPQQYGQRQTAQRGEIQPAPQQESQHMVDAHLPVVPQEGEGKQRRHRAQPEQQVQRDRQRPQANVPAHRPHPVVDQAQRRPQQEALAKNGRQDRDVYVHTQRSRREKKPPRLPPPSSS